MKLDTINKIYRIKTKHDTTNQNQTKQTNKANKQQQQQNLNQNTPPPKKNKKTKTKHTYTYIHIHTHPQPKKHENQHQSTTTKRTTTSSSSSSTTRTTANMFGFGGGGFNGSKLKAQLKMAVSRFQIASNKKQALMKQNMREVACLLAEDPPKEEKARIRAESLIRDDNLIEAYEILQLECEVLSERIKLLECCKQCPPDLVSVVSTLMYSAPRVDIPELHMIRKQFRAKYGKKFEDLALQNIEGVLNERVVAKLSIHPPAAYLVQTYLERICEQFDVDWKPTIQLSAEQMIEPMAAPVGFSVQSAQGTGLGVTNTITSVQTGQERPGEEGFEINYQKLPDGTIVQTTSSFQLPPPAPGTATTVIPPSSSSSIATQPSQPQPQPQPQQHHHHHPPQPLHPVVIAAPEHPTPPTSTRTNQSASSSNTFDNYPPQHYKSDDFDEPDIYVAPTNTIPAVPSAPSEPSSPTEPVVIVPSAPSPSQPKQPFSTTSSLSSGTATATNHHTTQSATVATHLSSSTEVTNNCHKDQNNNNNNNNDDNDDDDNDKKNSGLGGQGGGGAAAAANGGNGGNEGGGPPPQQFSQSYANLAARFEALGK